jgi:hypothetical protein
MTDPPFDLPGFLHAAAWTALFVLAMTLVFIEVTTNSIKQWLRERKK